MGMEWNGIRACLGSIAMVAEPLLVSFVCLFRSRKGGRGKRGELESFWHLVLFYPTLAVRIESGSESASYPLPSV